MNRFTQSVAAFAFGAMALVCVAQAADVTTIKLGLSSSKPHPFNDAGDRFAAAVDKLSNGQMKVQIFPSRQLGDDKALTEGVRFGTVDMTLMAASAWASLIPAIDALQLPFLINTYKDLAELAVTPEAAGLYKNLGENGVVGLAIYEGGQRQFLTVDRVIKTMDDFKGLKTRVAPVRLHLDVFRAIGVNPTPMAYGEVYTGLETKTIDAVEINISSIVAEKYNEIAKHVLLTHHYFFQGLLTINKARFDKLTPDQQTILRQAATETVKPQIMALDAYDASMIDSLKKQGVSFTTPTPELLANLRAAVKPIYAAYAAKNDPAIDAFVKAAERLHS